GGGGIAEASGRQENAAGEVIVQEAFDSKAGAEATAVAIDCASLEEVLAAHPHVASKAKPAKKTFNTGNSLLLVQAVTDDRGEIGAHIFDIGLQLGHGFFLLAGRSFDRCRLVVR